jgi:hypothetical protein
LSGWVISVNKFIFNNKQIIRNQTALEYVRKHNSVVRQDPVVQREFKLYLANTERKATNELNKIVENPVNCCWYQDQSQKSINNKRDIQKLISSILQYWLNII